MAGNRHSDGFFNKPWAMIVTGAVLLIVAYATVLSAGCLGSTAGLPVPGTTAETISSGSGVPSHAVAFSGTPGVLSYDVVMTSGYELGEVAVPDKGVFIRVIYRGGYAGTWSSGNETSELRDSGERIFAVENPGSTLSVDMLKLDSSFRQPLVVEVWKDGTRRAANSTSLPYGEVTVSATP